MQSVHWSPVLKPAWRRQGEGVEVRHFSQFHFGGLSSPFLHLDHYRLERPVHPPHPHAGFSAVTYLPESAGTGLRSRNSLGQNAELSPGDLQWTLAGRGLMLEETPLVEGGLVEGFQIFVNLKEKHKEVEPASFHVRSEEAPRVTNRSGACVKVCAGRYLDQAAAFALPEAPDLWDVNLDVGAAFTLPLRAAGGGLLYAYGGSVTIDCEAPFIVREGGAVGFRVKDPTEVIVRAREPARLLVLQGTVTDEPIVFRGPFAMTSEEALAEAVRRFRAGEMGSLEPSA